MQRPQLTHDRGRIVGSDLHLSKMTFEDVTLPLFSILSLKIGPTRGK